MLANSSKWDLGFIRDMFTSAKNGVPVSWFFPVICNTTYVKSAFSIDRVFIGKYHFFFLNRNLHNNLNHMPALDQRKLFRFAPVSQAQVLDL